MVNWTAAAAAKSLQSCPILCYPIDSSPSVSPVPGIPQARTLEWVAISFSNAWKQKVKVKSLSRVQLLATPWTAAYQAPPTMGFSRQEYWSGVPLRPTLNPYAGVLTPRTSECVLIWRQRLFRGNQFKMRSLWVKWGQNQPLMQYNWYPYEKRKFGSRHILIKRGNLEIDKHTERTLCEYKHHLQAKERGQEQTLPSWPLKETALPTPWL